MHHQIIKSAVYFQDILSSRFRRIKSKIIDTLPLLSIRKYPITFDSWYGRKKLVDILLDLGFVSVLVHGKSNYVMDIRNKTAKLSVHKKEIQLQPNQWGCDKPDKPKTN